MDHSNSIRGKLRDGDSGQDLVEYVLIIVFLSLSVTVALLSMQCSVSTIFVNATQTVQSQRSF